jgi:hypothetical protein
LQRFTVCLNWNILFYCAFLLWDIDDLKKLNIVLSTWFTTIFNRNENSAILFEMML